MFHQLVWQIPPLSLTGESFLFLISLGAGVSNIARIIAALLGIVVALCCMHSLDRLKVSEWYDARMLKILMHRDPQQMPAVLGSEYRRKLAEYYKTTWKRDYDWWFSSNCEGMGEFFQFTSILSWTFCFWGVILANIIILALATVQFTTGDDRYFW